MSDNYNFCLNLGASFVVDLVYTDDEGAAIDISAWTGELIADDFTLELTLGADGSIVGSVLNTTDWAPGQQSFRLKLIDVDAAEFIILQGTITVHNKPLFD